MEKVEKWSTRRCLKMVESLHTLDTNDWRAMSTLLNNSDTDCIHLDPRLEDVSARDCIDKYHSLVAEVTKSKDFESHLESEETLERITNMLKLRRRTEVKSLLADNAEEIRTLAEQLAKSKSKLYTPACDTVKDTSLLDVPVEKVNLKKKSFLYDGEDLNDKKHLPSSPVNESPESQSQIYSPSGKKRDIPVGSLGGVNGPEQSCQLRTRLRHTNIVPKEGRLDHPVKKIYKKSSKLKKHTIASRVTTRHDRALKKKKPPSPTRSMILKPPHPTPSSSKDTSRKTSLKLPEIQKASKSSLERRTLRSTASIPKKSKSVRALKSSSKNVTSNAEATESMHNYKSHRDSSIVELAKSSMSPAHKRKKSSLLKKVRKYKKRVTKKK